MQSPDYAITKFYLARAFFKANGFINENSLNVQLPKSLPFTQKKRIQPPRVEVVVRIAEFRGTSYRNRALIHTERSTGIRTATLTSICFGKGDPILPMSSIKEQILERRKNLMIAVFPEMKEINPSACKNNTRYYVFTDELATMAIIDFLIWRLDKYVLIPDEAPLFETEHNKISPQKRNTTPLSSREICLIFKKAAERAKIADTQAFTPKTLRILFRQLLRNQSPDVQLDFDEKEFFMGHRLGKPQESYFDIYDVDRLRAKFARLDLMHSPIFGDEQKEREDDRFFNISKDLDSAYSELVKKIEAMENAKQKQLFDNSLSRN